MPTSADFRFGKDRGRDHLVIDGCWIALKDRFDEYHGLVNGDGCEGHTVGDVPMA